MSSHVLLIMPREIIFFLDGVSMLDLGGRCTSGAQVTRPTSSFVWTWQTTIGNRKVHEDQLTSETWLAIVS